MIKLQINQYTVDVYPENQGEIAEELCKKYTPHFKHESERDEFLRFVSGRYKLKIMEICSNRVSTVIKELHLHTYNTDLMMIVNITDNLRTTESETDMLTIWLQSLPYYVEPIVKFDKINEMRVAFRIVIIAV